MKIEQLRYFIEAVKAGSINAASKKLYISQQSLNKSLHSLEDEFGFMLLNRTSRGITLTEEGEIVFNSAQAIVARHNQMMSQIGQLHEHQENSLSGRINIHISPMLSISLLPKVYVDYMHTYPNMQIYCQEKYRDDIVDMVAHNSGDVGFVLVADTIESFYQRIPPHVQLEVLTSYPIYMAMSPCHPLAHQRSLSLAAIEKYPIIVYEAGGLNGIHALQYHAHLNVVLSTNNYHMCEELISEGNSLMYSFPIYQEKNLFKNCVHIPLADKSLKFVLYMVYNKEANNKERRLIDSFSSIFQQYI